MKKKSDPNKLKFGPWNFALAFATGGGYSLAHDMFSGANFEKIFPSPPPIDFDKLLPEEFMRSKTKRQKESKWCPLKPKKFPISADR